MREMFRIAAGEELGYDDPKVEGHSIEFRINAEDPGSNFMPAPGTLTHWHQPSGPGVRVDGGYDQHKTVPGAFERLMAEYTSRQDVRDKMKGYADMYTTGKREVYRVM